MPFDQPSADRVRVLLQRKHIPVEKKMMGGLVFMIDGHMCCGVSGQGLMIRVGQAQYDSRLDKPYTRPLEFGGRRPKGFLVVEPEGFATDSSLRSWVEIALKFVATLPPKA